MEKELYAIGEIPPLGKIPRRMYAQVIRPERYGRPLDAFKIEVLDVPEPGRGEVLVLVMAAGINYNNVWAATGSPLDVAKGHAKWGQPADFHVGGSDAAGIVYAVGEAVQGVAVGDHVVVHPGMWDTEDAEIRAGLDPCFSPTYYTWGYESNWGGFAQFTRVQAHQCLPKAPHLTWEQAAAPTLAGATAYRMLTGWSPHVVRPGDPVLVWGGGGGVGVMAIQIARVLGGEPVAVVSSSERAEYCRALGAVGVIDRTRFDHWGVPPHWRDTDAYAAWAEQAKRFGREFWRALGAKRNPRIIVEHPGEDTIATSVLICDVGGMTVICAGTSGYQVTGDLRHLWMRQKRIQGSHFANDEQSLAFNALVAQGLVNPCLSRTFSFDAIGAAHQLMMENRHPPGNMAALVSAPTTGLTGLPRQRSFAAAEPATVS